MEWQAFLLLEKLTIRYGLTIIEKRSLLIGMKNDRQERTERKTIRMPDM